MGKKSVMESQLLPSPDGQDVDSFEVALGPEQNGLWDIFQEVLQVALQAHVGTQERRSKSQVIIKTCCRLKFQLR